MRWREDGRTGKDVMLGQLPISRLSRLERTFRFPGRDSILHSQKYRCLTDKRFTDSPNEADGSLQSRRARYGGTINPSALSIWLSSTKLLTVSHFWTQNCEMQLAVRFGTSIKLRFSSCEEDKPSREHRSGRPHIYNDSREVRWPIDKHGELLQHKMERDFRCGKPLMNESAARMQPHM